jgi:flagellar motility protein MotE (MotC chaperone)
MLNIPLPRLLPTTITAMVVLLVFKCAVLLQGAITLGPKPERVMVAVASAEGAEHIQEAPKPVPPSASQTPSTAGAEKKPGEKKPGEKTIGDKATGDKTTGEKPARPVAAATPPAGPTQTTDAAASSVPAADAPPPVTDGEKALLQELRQRRKELEARADSVTTRESVLVAAEQKLGARVGELQSLQKRLEGLDTAQKQKEDAGWQGLVKLYEAMKPREAATIFNELSMPVLLQVLDRMKDAKAAAVMAAMNPDKARDVTDGLAQMRTGRDQTAVSAPKFGQLGG